ncbi:MAG: threonine synthase [Saprospiraceae bacterium]|nr:threonine synthase [Saprospiraceae bacterium]
MQLYSTNNPALRTNLREAIFQGLPVDNGLFMPVEIPVMPAEFSTHLKHLTFQEIALGIAKTFIGEEIPDLELERIITGAITFPAPVIHLDDLTGILELFYGPTLAFKDFGARFMAQVMAYFNMGETQSLTILVATSGDTGGAVAAGFLKTPGIRVVILYPSGQVSPIQEKQLTSLGHNISAIEVHGTFDECQSMVKQAFLDKELRQLFRLSSANSINISRLIPQVMYYWEGYKQVAYNNKPIVFSVPSGNFGNLTAGLIARKMGLPVHHFIAATNANDTVPAYLSSGIFTPRPSIRTISNAMDVGNPSNFARMLHLCGSTWNMMQKHISGFAFDDIQTREAMQYVYSTHNYVFDPHGAVGYLAWKKYQETIRNHDAFGIVLETAHPAKFREEVETILDTEISMPSTLARLQAAEKIDVPMQPLYTCFRNWLLENLQ